MSDERATELQPRRSSHAGRNANPCGAVYGLGLVGALIYFVQSANSFGDGVLGVLKALVWPAVTIYKLLTFLG